MTADISPSGSTVAEAEAFLAAHPEIEAFDIILHDANGIGRGKIIRRHELLSFYNNGRHLPISILGLDICGEDVHETGLIWDQGDGDLRAWPIPGTLVALHKTNPPRGEVFMSMYTLDGAPMTSDPRHSMRAQVDELAAEGLHPAGAFELEFFLLDPERGADGKMHPARDVLDGRKSTKTEVYSVDHLHGMLPLFSDIYAGAKLAGITAETLISEYAPGQYELTLNYRRDVMQAADDLMRLKRIVRAQARSYGVTACFMAKPNENYAGSGMHFHVSMLDDAGRQCVHRGERRRLERQHPARPWRAERDDGGIDAGLCAPCQQLASVRRAILCAGQPDMGGQQPLCRAADPGGRYQGAADRTSPGGGGFQPLSGGGNRAGRDSARHGEQIDPGAETTGNGYEDSGTSNIPTDWKSAIELAKGSTFLKNALGADMHRTFTAIKSAEYARVMRTVSEVDFDLYLHTV